MRRIDYRLDGKFWFSPAHGPHQVPAMGNWVWLDNVAGVVETVAYTNTRMQDAINSTVGLHVSHVVQDSITINCKSATK